MIHTHTYLLSSRATQHIYIFDINCKFVFEKDAGRNMNFMYISMRSLGFCKEFNYRESDFVLRWFCVPYLRALSRCLGHGWVITSYRISWVVIIYPCPRYMLVSAEGFKISYRTCYTVFKKLYRFSVEVPFVNKPQWVNVYLVYVLLYSDRKSPCTL